MNEEISRELAETARHYVDKVVDAPLKEIGGLLTDTISYWRFKNKVNTILKAKRFLEGKGIEPKKLLPDVFVPLIEEAGNVQNEKLSDMFASLLASQLDPNSQDIVHPSYAKTLGQLSALDAMVIDNFYKAIKNQESEKRIESLTIEIVMHNYKISEQETLLSFQNIWRLGICDHGDGLSNLNRVKQLVFTDFGWSFIKACNIH
jgi:hypothetical protein